jgi:hypothetical protein
MKVHRYRPYGIGGQVVEIVLELDPGIFSGGAIALLDKASVPFQLLHKLRALRARTHSTHLALEDIEEVWKFVYMCLA